MIGAIAGDVIGSIHEGAGTKTKQFPLFGPHVRFTDDTALTVLSGSAVWSNLSSRSSRRCC
jgi:ADP-ribosylglycohydrolase